LYVKVNNGHVIYNGLNNFCSCSENLFGTTMNLFVYYLMKQGFLFMVYDILICLLSVYDIWYMVYDIWYMIYGIWYMIYGIWYMVY